MSQIEETKESKPQKQPRQLYVEKGSNKSNPETPPQEKRERPQRQQQQLYVPKGEGESKKKEDIQEQQKQKPKRERKEQQPREEKPKKEQKPKKKYNYDWKSVTVDTVIPELPSKDKLIPKPSYDDLDKKLDNIEDQIDKVFAQKKKYREEIKKTQEELMDNSDLDPIKKQMKIKIEQKRAIIKELQEIKVQFNNKKNEVSDYEYDIDELRSKMKNIEKPEEILSKLNQLKNRQLNGRLTPHEEKTICKQIFDLESSLPYAEPLDLLNRKLDKVLKEKKVVGILLKETIEKINKLEEEIQAHSQQFNSIKETKNETKKNLNPEVEAKFKEFDDKIEKLKQSKIQVKDAFYEQYDKYDEQQEFIEHTEWLIKQKQRLLDDIKYQKEKDEKKKRYEDRLKRQAEEEEKRKQEEEEFKKKKKMGQFQSQIELCEQLLSYCKNLKPNNKDVKFVQKSTQDVETKLKTDEQWKKEKVTVVKQKSERKEDEWGGLVKKNKPQKQPQQEQPKQQETGEKSNFLNHGYQTIGFFDSLKIPIPYKIEDLDQAIDSIQERLNYYKKAATDAEDVQDEQKPREDRQKRNDDNGDKGRKANLRISEDEFPSLQSN